VVDPKTEKCLPCSENCRTCNENDTTKCITCPQDLVLTLKDKCEKECPPGTFFKKQAERCKECINNCLKCENEVTCKVCEPGSYLQPNKESCDKDCPLNYRKNENGECEKCSDEKCNKCDSNKNICDVCEPNSYLLNENCVPECPAGYYSDPQKNCLKCDPQCAECITEKQCTKCFNINDSLLNYECKEECPPGSVSIFSIEVNPKDNSQQTVKKCEKCEDEKCAKCDITNLKNCINCKGDNFIFVNKDGEQVCVEECPLEYFVKKSNSGSDICEPCSKNCKECFDETTCKRCVSGLLEEGRCVESCNDGNYQKDGKCFKCDDDKCLKCSSKNPSKCEKCKEIYFLKDDSCQPNCGDNFMEVNNKDTGNICKPCIKDCKVCDHEGECKECIEPKFVSPLDGHCVDCKEDSGSVIIDKICYKCQITNCAKCPQNINRLGECVQCYENFYLTPIGTCDPECPPGYFKDRESRKCVKCFDERCLKCEPENKCTECNDGLYLYNGICQNECNAGFSPDKDRICKPCKDENCKICGKNENNDKCFSCIEPFILQYKKVIFYWNI